jgi:hypothetical protein
MKARNTTKDDSVVPSEVRVKTTVTCAPLVSRAIRIMTTSKRVASSTSNSHPRPITNPAQRHARSTAHDAATAIVRSAIHCNDAATEEN